MDKSQEQKITRILLQQGKKYLENPNFAGKDDPDATALVRNLDKYPHAFVLACLMDRMIAAEKAWVIPYRFKTEKLNGSFSFSRLSKLTEKETVRFMVENKLHTYSNKMGRTFYKAVQRIKSEYGGNASRIWSGVPSSAEVVYRFLQFDGGGPKIATMAAKILVQYFNIPFSEDHSIDISVDTHVKRVFQRLGLVREGAKKDEYVYRARGLCPKCPGFIDTPVWHIGRNWCKKSGPKCRECYMEKVCDYALRHK